MTNPLTTKIESIALSALRPYARNSRTHSQAQIKKIAAALREFGFLNPIVIDADNTILAGHARLEAAKIEGMTAVPCIRASHLSEAQRRAFVIADNRLAEDSGWDADLLREEMAFLSSDSFDMSVLGFEAAQLDAYMGALDEQPFTVPEGHASAPGAPTATKTQNGYAAFTVVFPVEDRKALTAAIKEHQTKHRLPDVASALLHMAGVRKNG